MTPLKRNCPVSARIPLATRGSLPPGTACSPRGQLFLSEVPLYIHSAVICPPSVLGLSPGLSRGDLLLPRLHSHRDKLLISFFFFFLILFLEFPLWPSGNKSMRTQVLSPASLSGLRILCCQELWCRSQTLLRSRIAVVVA